MIRLIFVALFVVLFLIIGIPVLGIEWLIGKVSKKTMDYSSLRLVQWAFKMIIKLAGISHGGTGSDLSGGGFRKNTCPDTSHCLSDRRKGRESIQYYGNHLYE